MKIFNKKILGAVFLGATIVAANTGCAKISDFNGQNTRTDASAIPLTSGLITSAGSTLASNTMSSTFAGLRASLYAQQISEEQYTEQSTYANPQLDFGGFYAGALEDIQKVINLNTDPATKGTISVISSGSNGNQLGVAKIMKAYRLWTITDRWGDVPVSAALQGAGNLNPSYDKQSEIYPALLTMLKTAMTDFDGGATVKGDLFYSGDAVKWKKLANSLRMLIALRMSKVYPNPSGVAAVEFAAAANDANGSILTNADNFTAKFTGANAVSTNVWYSALNGRKDYDLSLTLADILNNLSDPRRGAYGLPGNPMPYGLTRDLAVAYAGSVNGNISRPFNDKGITTPVVIVPAAYVLLAQAEAAQRGWWTPTVGTAQTLYEAGVAASFAQWGSGSATAYLAGAANFLAGTGGGTNVGFLAAYPSIVGASATTTTSLQRIQLQKYLACFGDGIQAWCEWRRTGVPNLKATAYATNSPKEIPRRFTYGVNEYATNIASVTAAAALLTGGDVMNARMWWDQ